MKFRATLVTISALAACAPVSDDASGPLLMAGFRYPADACRIVGEDEYTNQFLDDSSVLVGCPDNYDELASFEEEVRPTRVGEYRGYILYSVPGGRR